MIGNDLNSEIWHRRILNGFWAVVCILIVGQLLFLSLGVQPNASAAVLGKKELFAACNLLILIFMAAAEMWLRTSWVYHKQAVAGCGFIVSYLVYFIVEPFVDGAQLALMMPIMLSLIYFDRRLLFGLSLFSIVFYAAVYFGLERPVLEKPLAEFVLVELIFAVFGVMGVGIIVRAREARDYVEQLSQSEQSLLVERAIADKLLKIDALTGLYNHKTFHEYLDTLLEQCETNGLRLQLALLDIDNFKQVNDTYGHWVGDLVLKEVAAELNARIGLNDFAARYGGEEFAIIFTDSSLGESYLLMEELRQGIARMEHPYAGGQSITASIGVCRYVPGDGKETLFRQADDALYHAKRTGKNKVMLHEEAAQSGGKQTPFSG